MNSIRSPSGTSDTINDSMSPALTCAAGSPYATIGNQRRFHN